MSKLNWDRSRYRQKDIDPQMPSMPKNIVHLFALASKRVNGVGEDYEFLVSAAKYARRNKALTPKQLYRLVKLSGVA